MSVITILEMVLTSSQNAAVKAVETENSGAALILLAGRLSFLLLS